MGSGQAAAPAGRGRLRRGVREGARPPLARARRRAATSAAGVWTLDKVVGVLERLQRARPGVLAVLTYHRVAPADERPDLLPGMISADPETFERQMDHLADRCRVVGLAEVLASRESGTPLPPASVLVTFDDAYADVADHAWPVLRARGLPMTLFVPTGYPDAGRSFWWDRLHCALSNSSRRVLEDITGMGSLDVDGPEACSATFGILRDRIKALPHDEAIDLVDELVERLGGDQPAPAVLGWEALRRLAGEGVELAPHGVSHALLTRLPGDRVEAELAGSREALEAGTGVRAPALAYPSGAWSPAVAAVATRVGYRAAFTTQRGVNVSDSAWMALRRINVGGATTVPLLRAQLLPALARSRRWSGPTAGGDGSDDGAGGAGGEGIGAASGEV